MRIPSSILKEVLKQAAVEVGKNAGSEVKSGIKEAVSESGKEAGKQWTESAIDKAKTMGSDTEYILSVEDAMEILREEESKLPDESEIDWTKKQLSQLSDEEFIELVVRSQITVENDGDEVETVDYRTLDEKEPHTNYLVTAKDLDAGEEFKIYIKITRFNNDLKEGSPEILADSLFNYIKMYDIEAEDIAVVTQESVDKYFQLESFAKYGIIVFGEEWLRRDASKSNINQSDLG